MQEYNSRIAADFSLEPEDPDEDELLDVLADCRRLDSRDEAVAEAVGALEDTVRRLRAIVFNLEHRDKGRD